MAHVRSSLLAIGVVGMTALAGNAGAGGLTMLLPDEAAGYRAEGDDGLFDRDSLFDLIDGSAEVYRALNVRAVLSRRYLKEDAADIMVDLFDMGSASDAFGAYHHDMRDGKKAGIGNESEVESGALFFWKGRYFVSIVALEDDAHTRKAARAIGKAIARAIPSDGAPPALVGMLPRKGRVASQLHYFHDWKLLSRHYRFGDGNPLGLSSDTEGILARYRRGKSRPAVVLIRYLSAKAAAEARARVDELFGSQERKGAAARAHGVLLSIVVDAADGRAARALLDEVRIPKGGQ